MTPKTCTNSDLEMVNKIITTVCIIFGVIWLAFAILTIGLGPDFIDLIFSLFRSL
jgi:hypothetical protein